MKRLGCFLLAGNLFWAAYGADNLRAPDMRSVGMGGNEVTQSSLFNPALIAFQPQKSIHVNYINRYLLKELGTFSGSCYLPNHWLSTGLDLSAFGYEEYKELMVRLSVAKALGERWSLGVAFHYSFLQTALLEQPQGRIATDVGILFKPLDNLLIGLLTTNLPAVIVGDKQLEIADFESYLVQFGFHWLFMNNLSITGSISVDERHKPMGSFGMEYTPYSTFFLRAGVQSAPLLPSIGIGYRLSRFTIDTAAIYHRTLGMSMGIGLSYFF